LRVISGSAILGPPAIHWGRQEEGGNKLREIGYVYKTQLKRVDLWRRGTLHFGSP
jgi:hypothetical protein